MMEFMTSQNYANDIQELHAYVHGWVQGVGFRYYVIEQALALGLRGYARNLRDGSVEVLAQGPRPALEGLLSRLREGSATGEVMEVGPVWRRAIEHQNGSH